MNSNPFYIKPAQPNLTPMLNGIGSMVTNFAKQNQQKELQNAFSEAWRSNDPDAIAKVASENPQYANALIGMMGHKNDITRESRRNMLGSIAQNPETMLDQMIAHKSTIEEQGGTSDITDEDIMLALTLTLTTIKRLLKLSTRLSVYVTIEAMCISLHASNGMHSP